MSTIFKEELKVIDNALESLNDSDFQRLLGDCKASIRAGGKVIVSGLGKNVPLCEKFVGTMISLGLPAAFMHTNSAIHGDMGMIQDGDTLALLSKSGETAESIHLRNLLGNRDIRLWLLSFSPDSTLSHSIDNQLLLNLEHECDPWNIVPNASSIVNLLVLQKLAMALAKEMNISLADFKRNHPGGHIGEILKCQNV